MFECRNCGVSKTLDAFPKRKDSPLGIRKECKDCFKVKNLVSARKYRKETPSYYAVQKSYYDKTNGEKAKARARRRRAVAGEPYTLDDLFNTYGTDCYLCGEEIDLNAPRKVGETGWEKGLHIEHYIDISLGGKDTLDNVRPSHGVCNLTKIPRGEKQCLVSN